MATNVSGHSARKTMIQWLTEGGHSVASIAKRSGHRNLNTIQNYTLNMGNKGITQQDSVCGIGNDGKKPVRLEERGHLTSDLAHDGGDCALNAAGLSSISERVQKSRRMEGDHEKRGTSGGFDVSDVVDRAVLGATNSSSNVSITINTGNVVYERFFGNK